MSGIMYAKNELMENLDKSENTPCISCGSTEYPKLNILGLCPVCAKKAKCYAEKRGFSQSIFNGYHLKD